MLSLFQMSTLIVLRALCVYGTGHLEQPQISSTRKLSKTARLECMVPSVTISTTSVYWYQERPGQAVQHLLHIFSNNTVKRESGILLSKFEAHMTPETSTSTLTVHSVREQDSATYYCALWDVHDIKVFGDGTKLVVTDRNLATDISPKPTIFLPSIAEINHSKTGTYLSLLEKFFPDIIEVYWKEKDGNRALPSQKGNTMKTTDTYMKFSWLTVAENSMDKEHICVVKHERNIGGINQEILFPSINEEVTGTGSKKDCLKDESEVTADHNSTKVCLKDESNTLQLQLMNTSAYYTYLLLLLKSAVYFIITTSCVFRRTGVCCDGKNL
ncbi:unnamed protein product [Rangifer tarandus platyrhynchus]|uniref:Uncharacterized protein n=1 Tax=Rangifer tarandus platyrhynchus TaxID=3082113 RepID=A0AC59YSG4_RANTA